MSTSAPHPLPQPLQPGAPYRILMVCTGNICRSAMAEVVLREQLADAVVPESRVSVTSAGVSSEEQGNPIDARARRVLQENGYGTSALGTSIMAGHQAHRVTEEELAHTDLFLAMTSSHAAALKQRLRHAGLAERENRVLMYRSFEPGTNPNNPPDAPDPWYGTMADFVDTYDVVEQVSAALTKLLA